MIALFFDLFNLDHSSAGPSRLVSSSTAGWSSTASRLYVLGSEESCVHLRPRFHPRVTILAFRYHVSFALPTFLLCSYLPLLAILRVYLKVLISCTFFNSYFACLTRAFCVFVAFSSCFSRVFTVFFSRFYPCFVPLLICRYLRFCLSTSRFRYAYTL